MKTLVFPIAIWRDADGCFTARTLDGLSAAATDATSAGALSQLKKHLAKQHRNQESFFEEPEMRDLQPWDFSLQVRPRYRTGRSVHPCGQTVSLRIPTVIGRRRDRSFVCTAPTIDVQLGSLDEVSVKNLMIEAVRESLSGLTPRELARFLAPSDLQVESLNIRAQTRQSETGELQLTALPAAADSLSDRGVRRRMGRALRIDPSIESLSHRIMTDNSSIVLLGDKGVGKSTLLVAAARKVERLGRKERESEEVHERRRMWLTNGARLIAGMRYLGEWEERCEDLINELSDLRGILCVDNLLELVRVGGGAAESSVAAFLSPYIAAGELRLIGEASPQEWDACQRLLPSFAALLEPFQVAPMDEENSQGLLQDLYIEMGRNSRVEIEESAALSTHRLFKRFLPYQQLPGRSPQFAADLVASRAVSPGPIAGKVTEEDVYRKFGEFSGLPQALLKDDQFIDFDKTAAQLAQRVIGQSEACRAAAEVVTRMKAGLNDPQRPLGVLLFCGPTGVGKTELAKSLAAYLFDADKHTDRLIRLDMSEYAGFGAAERLMAQPDGEPSRLVKQVRMHPFSVILLDEIEKASPDVFDALLGVLDEGRLTDSFGRTATFRSSVIIMTSNLGASRTAPVGYETAPANFLKAVQDAFRPEFFNRIDRVVSFDALTRDSVREIAAKELDELKRREGLSRFDIRLQWTPEVVDVLVQGGFDANFGARPLQREIERKIVVPISHWIAEHPGTTATLSLTVDQNRVVVGAQASSS